MNEGYPSPRPQGIGWGVFRGQSSSERAIPGEAVNVGRNQKKQDRKNENEQDRKNNERFRQAYPDGEVDNQRDY
jgi:hypothetical protein